MVSGFLVGAPRSGSGKTLVSLGLIGALRARGLRIAAAKTGPDYIDAAILSRAAGAETINLDAWAMGPQRLRRLVSRHAVSTDLLVVEGVMGLFDGAADGTGSSGDLAETLGLPVVLVVDAERQGQSVAPLVAGFASWRAGVRICGLVLNRVGSSRHETMLRDALDPLGMPVLGALPRSEHLVIPGRHLGLVLPGETERFEAILAAAAALVAEHCDLDRLLALVGQTAQAEPGSPPAGAALPPLGQHIAIARDDAFAFLYPHWLADWRDAGAELSFFSPLADAAPSPEADAVFLPGGYPELHAAKLAAAAGFRAGLTAAARRGALVYGECGGFMVLGRSLTDASGSTFAMAGLLPVETRIDRPRRVLGYRRLTHASPLPWPVRLAGHEFHYSSASPATGTPLFAATDASGAALAPMGLVDGRVMGSYAHVIDLA